MSNKVYFVTVLVTNWVFTGDTKFEGGTNYSQLRAVVTKQTLIEEVSLCTNRTIYKVSAETTNGLKWQVNPVPPMLSPPQH